MEIAFGSLDFWISKRVWEKSAWVGPVILDAMTREYVLRLANPARIPTGEDGIDVGIGVGVSVDVGVGIGVSVDVGIGMGVSVDVGIDIGISVGVDPTSGVDSISGLDSTGGLDLTVGVDLTAGPLVRPQASERLSSIARRSTLVFFIVYLQICLYNHSERSWLARFNRLNHQAGNTDPNRAIPVDWPRPAMPVCRPMLGLRVIPTR